jgi:hypothetical protein
MSALSIIAKQNSPILFCGLVSGSTKKFENFGTLPFFPTFTQNPIFEKILRLTLADTFGMLPETSR